MKRNGVSDNALRKFRRRLKFPDQIMHALRESGYLMPDMKDPRHQDPFFKQHRALLLTMLSAEEYKLYLNKIFICLQ